MLSRLCTFRPRTRWPTGVARMSTRPNLNASVQNKVTATLAVAVVGGASAAYFFLPSPSRSAPTLSAQPLSPSHFTPATITASEKTGTDTRLLTLTVPPHLIPKPTFVPIWSVFIKDDDIQVERPYTPLQGIDEHGQILFWVKKYPRGEVGRWLHSKSVGDTVEFRGPLKTYNWDPEKWDHVVMISGGTGITPFYQLLHHVIPNNLAPGCKFSLLHSSRLSEDLPPPFIMDTLRSYAHANPQRFNLHVFVSSKAAARTEVGVHVGRIDEFAIRKSTGPEQSWWSRWTFFGKEKPTNDSRTLFLVCGPDSMIQAIAGPYGRNFSQGALGGALASLGYTSSQVWKL